MSTEKKIWIIVVISVALFSFGLYNVYRPDTLPMSFVRGDVRQLTGKVVLGPYPTEREIKKLKRLGVVAFVNLMDSSNPLERDLIENEREAASKLGLKVINFPMGFVKLGSESNKSTVVKAVDLVESMAAKIGPDESIYVHCYLGRHRVGVFAKAYTARLEEAGKAEPQSLNGQSKENKTTSAGKKSAGEKTK